MDPKSRYTQKVALLRRSIPLDKLRFDGRQEDMVVVDVNGERTLREES